MLVHSKDYVTNVDDNCIQPNAVDIRVNYIAKLAPQTQVFITECMPKQFIPRIELLTHEHEGNLYWVLDPRTSYEFLTPHEVTVPEGMCGWIVPRSTLARNGFLIGNGLYDSGYSGIIGGVLHNLSGSEILLQKDTRVAQFVMVTAESSHLYDGHYNHNGGFSNPE